MLRSYALMMNASQVTFVCFACIQFDLKIDNIASPSLLRT